MTATLFHLTVGGESWCQWTGSKAGADIARASGVHICQCLNRARVEASADALRPHFKAGAVAVVEGRCPHDTAEA